MAENYEIAGNLLKIELQSSCVPVFEYSANKEWVKFGKYNNYPDYLIDLYNRNAIHGSIVKGKSAYVYGKGLSMSPDGTVLNQAKAQLWLENANRYESWNEIYEKICKYYELFNGFALQIIWNFKGTIAEVYCMEFSKLRRSKDGKKVFYCDEWIDDNGRPTQGVEKKDSYTEYDLFNPNIRTGTQIFYFKADHPSTQKYGHLYPIPEYGQCTADIETDIEITSFHFHNLKNGMFASALLAFFDGKPDDAEKKKIAKMFNYTHAGTVNTGKLILNFNDKGGTPPTLESLTPDKLDKMFEQVGKRLQQNIFTGHRADPVLFGVMTEGSLSDTGGEATLKKWDKFQRAYVEGRQETILDQIKMLGAINGVDLDSLIVEQTTPAGADLPIDANILGLFDKADLQKYFAKKYGIEVTIPALPAGSHDPVLQEGMVNEHVKNLTGKQWIQIKRLIREVNKGTTEKDVAKMLIKTSTNLGDAEIELLLKTPESSFSKFNNDTTNYALELFELSAVDDCITDEIVSEEFVNFKSAVDCFKFELSKKQNFDITEDQKNSVLDILKGNPETTPDQIAKQLNSSLGDILSILEALALADLVSRIPNGWGITPKGINKNIPSVETEVYTVYKYVTRDDVPEVKTTSRPFCKKMLALSRAGKVWTRDALESLTNNLGEDAWTYRGGFYTNPDDGETTPYCRHIWAAITKSRTKKK